MDAGSATRVVTVIEVLSLSNKQPGEGQRMYLSKQRELAEAGVSLVEVDLLRVRQRVPNARPEGSPSRYRTPCQVCVRRGY